MIGNEFMSVKEFAFYLGIHPNTVRRSIQKGKIVAFKVGVGKKSSYRISKSEANRMASVDLEFIIEKVIQKRNEKKLDC